jgi:hypothetical protein
MSADYIYMFWSFTECPDGKECRSTNMYHYRDFKHETLAEERALAGADNASDLEPELEEELLNEEGTSKRKYVGDNDVPESKRIKSPVEIEISDGSEISESESNPFLQPAELEDYHVGTVEEDQQPLSGNATVLYVDSNVILHAEESRFEELSENSGISQDGPFMPCEPGICDKEQLGVAVTLQTPGGGEIKVSHCNV